MTQLPNNFSSFPEQSEQNYEAILKRYNLILEITKTGIWDWNLKDHTTYFDPSYFILSGYQVDAFPHTVEQFFSRVHKEDQEQLIESVELCVSGKTDSFSSDFRFQHASGRWQWLRGSGRVLSKDEQGKASRILGMHIDIDHLKSAQTDASQAEFRYQELFNSIQSGVAVYQTPDNGKTFLFADFNHAAEQIEMKSKRDLIGASVLDVFPAIEEFGLYEVFQRVWKTGNPEQHPVSLYEDKDLVGWRENYVYKLPTDEIVAVYQDITEQKKKEVFLEKSRAQFQQLFESNPDALWLEDITELRIYFNQLRDQGIEDITTLLQIPDEMQKIISKIKILDINQATIDLYGATEKKPLIEDFPQTFTEESLITFKQILANIYREAPPQQLESIIKKSDGSLVNILINYTLLTGWDDDSDLIMLTMKDITRKKRIEEELIKSQQFKSISTLAGGIAHDFNNILMGIFGNMELAKDELDKSHPAYSFLLSAEKAMKRATQLSNQLLTFTDSKTPEKEDTSLAKILENVIRFDLSGSNIQPVFQFDPNLWLAKVDQAQIHQVFSQLALNAREAMKEGGQLEIRLENLSLKNTHFPLTPGSYIKVIFKDSGIGMTPEVVSQVFNPYFTTDSIRSGMGLTICKSILEKHEGMIEVESELNKGSTFTLFLPANKEQHDRINGKTISNKEEDSGLKILVMDDEEILRTLLFNMLKKLGHKVITVEDGRSAVDTYLNALNNDIPFDLVFLDLTIPGEMGGQEAMQLLLKESPSVKAVVTSGYKDSPVMKQFHEFGFQARLEKPFTMEELKTILKQLY